MNIYIITQYQFDPALKRNVVVAKGTYSASGVLPALSLAAPTHIDFRRDMQQDSSCFTVYTSDRGGIFAVSLKN
jgi:hypothetical protein